MPCRLFNFKIASRRESGLTSEVSLCSMSEVFWIRLELEFLIRKWPLHEVENFSYLLDFSLEFGLLLRIHTFSRCDDRFHLQMSIEWAIHIHPQTVAENFSVSMWVWVWARICTQKMNTRTCFVAYRSPVRNFWIEPSSLYLRFTIFWLMKFIVKLNQLSICCSDFHERGSRCIGKLSCSLEKSWHHYTWCGVVNRALMNLGWHWFLQTGRRWWDFIFRHTLFISKLLLKNCTFLGKGIFVSQKQRVGS